MTKSIENLSCSDIENPALRDFFGAWLDVCGDTRARWQDTHLEMFGQHVRHIDKSRYSRAADRFQLKFLGTHTLKIGGTDTTGRFLDELPNFQASLKRFRRLVETGRPYLASGVEFRKEPMKARLYDVLVCPLFDDTGRVSGVMSRTDFGS